MDSIYVFVPLMDTSDGSPYCGGDTNLQNTRLGQGPDVVFSLIDKFKFKLKQGSTVTMDNLFTSLPLLDKLIKQVIYVKIDCKVHD